MTRVRINKAESQAARESPDRQRYVRAGDPAECEVSPSEQSGRGQEGSPQHLGRRDAVLLRELQQLFQLFWKETHTHLVSPLPNVCSPSIALLGRLRHGTSMTGRTPRGYPRHAVGPRLPALV